LVFRKLEKEPSCLSLCYKRNTDQCQIKPEPISEQEESIPEQMASHLPPLKQISSGTLPENVTCKESLVLIFKATDNSPACVKQSTAQKLLERGWTELGHQVSETEVGTGNNPRDLEVMDRGQGN